MTHSPACLHATAGTELDAYSTCVEKHPERWQGECAELKATLTACAAKHSGMVNSLKDRCRGQIEQYERCLKANANSPDACVPQLERLWACSEQADARVQQHACGPDCKH